MEMLKLTMLQAADEEDSHSEVLANNELYD